MEGEFKILFFFFLALFQCNRNGSSCTLGNTDKLNCLDSKRVERHGASSVLCLHYWLTSGRALQESSNKTLLFLFNGLCLKGTFWYVRISFCPGVVDIEEPIGIWVFCFDFMWILWPNLWPKLKFNSNVSLYDRTFMPLNGCLLIYYVFITWKNHDLLPSDSWRLIQADDHLYYLIIQTWVSKNPSHIRKFWLLGTFDCFSLSIYFRTTATNHLSWTIKPG